MNPDSEFSIGDMTVRVIVSDSLIEAFEAILPRAGLGPDRHFHTGMDEIFYVQSGKVEIHQGDTKVIATPGMVVRVPKLTEHEWKSVEGPARMLFSFVPGNRQTRYLRELSALAQSGASWQESIAVLREKYDNQPV
jgi:mannose-6-phosphate isomerase-like protein (cupin superfamily)